MSEQSLANRKARYSLGHNLLLWFLLLALLPLSLTAWLGYRQAVDGLYTMVTQELERGARDNTRFVQNWFDYRLIDLNSQAQNQRNAELLSVLQESFQASGKSLAEFVKSYTWASLVDERQHDLITFTRHYDYIYNLFMLDSDGNILFTVARESDLGSNLFKGPYADTRFAHIAKSSLDSGQSLFSDLERYAPSNNLLTGFLAAPMLNEWGDKIGVFAIQLRFERISELMPKQHNENTLTHYLVGEDGLLRTPTNQTEVTDVLIQRIDTDQFKLWKKKHGKNYKYNEQDHPINVAFDYRGPAGKQVIGIHQTVKLPGTNWGMISEIDQDEALASAHKLGKIILVIFLITGAVVAVLAIYQARRITRPIIQLANASLAVAAGEVDHQVTIKSSNEIGILAGAFNHMLAVRRKHELALEQSSRETKKALIELDEQKFALDQHAIVAITDAQGFITFVNDKFSEISGYRRDELLGKNHRMLNSGYHDAIFFRDMYRIISSGKVWHGEICNKNKNGQYYWVETTIVPFTNDHENPESYIAIRTDITERKQAGLDLLQAKEAAEAATRQKSDFLANMSHEIRTPMNGIIGMTGLLLDTRLNVKQRSYADATISSANALLTIINDILDYSKIEAGKMELESVPFDLQSLSEDVAELMALKCREKNLEMLLRYKPGTQRLVIGDPGRVRQILLNLLSNAIKFTEQGYILLTVESIETMDEKVFFNIAVQDTGIGIAEDKLEHIFNKFDQEDSSTTRKYGGTGLGLSICQQLCNMMHGDIQVDSQKGEGSTFRLTMKLNVSEEQPASYANLGNYDQLKGLKTLVVDDTEIARTILIEQLSVLQMRLSSVDSGKLAIETLRQAIAENDPFDIVITDYHMPEINGETLVKQISQLDLLVNGAMLFITSSPRKDESSRLKSMGVDGYLTKPVYPSEVSQILSLVWDTKQQGQDIPLITRHTIREAKTGGRKKSLFTDTQILLTEDNPINVMVATELLEGYGCTVTPAGNGREALMMIKERRFDLIFMDCQMPEMDGFEATAAIRKHQTNNVAEQTPIIAFTANAMKSDQEKCLNAGMDDYISKPVNQESLENVLAKWLPHKLQKVMNHQEEEQGQSIKIFAEYSEALDLEVFYKLKKIFGEKFSSAIEQHTQNSHKNVKCVETAIQQGDFKTLERAAHSLKGSSAQFGAIYLSAVAVNMETLAKSEELDKASILLAELKTAQEQVAHAMLQQIDERIDG